MDANQVGFVHELTWEEIKTAARRRHHHQAAGGRWRCSSPAASRRSRPTSSMPCAYARKVGYNSVQAATNGIEFAKSPEFCKQAAEAGLRYAYLQFDGIGNAANSHRQVGNLFDVKLRAIENLLRGGRGHRAGDHHRERHQQRAGRAHRAVRARQPAQDVVPVLPAGLVHRAATSRSPTSGARRSATRCRTWRTTSRRKPGWASRRATGFPSPS